MAHRTDYGTLRIKPETIELLKELKDAFDASYGKRFTMDEFVRQMAASIEEGDPGVWEIYCTQQAQKEELKQKVEASRKMREKKNK